MKIPISEIKIGDRFRKDLGDIDLLVDSIARVGLIQPVIISEAKELICGRRRIAAYVKLGRTEIEAIVLSFTQVPTPEKSREIEAAENIVR